MEEWFYEKIDKYFGCERSYLRLQNCIKPPAILTQRLNQLETPVNGFELGLVFQYSRIDFRIGEAKIRNKLRKIILIDIKNSDYERCSGRYIAYTLTEVGDNLYKVNHTQYGSHRLPSGWNQFYERSKYHFI